MKIIWIEEVAFAEAHAAHRTATVIGAKLASGDEVQIALNEHSMKQYDVLERLRVLRSSGLYGDRDKAN